MNELLPDYPDSKVNACVEEVNNPGSVSLLSGLRKP